MESGPSPPDRPRDDEPGSAGAPQTPPPGPDTPVTPGEPVAPSAPQAPPPGPQAPPPGPQAPPPGSQAAPAGAQAPPSPQAAPAGPQAPGGPATQPEAPRAPGQGAPSYGGPVPPGGWQQPIARPQGWGPGQPLASWGSRVGAAAIDWLVLLIPAVILFIVVVAGAIGISGDGDASAGAVIAASVLFAILISLVWLLYAPVLMMREGAHNGQTWGKQLVGIRVVRDNGQRMSFGWAALREVVVKGLAVGIASSIIPLIPWLLDVLWPLWDDQNRALHDMAVQTHVVRA